MAKNAFRERDGGAWLRTAEPLIWFGGGGHEVRNSPSYFFDASTRTDRQICLQLTLAGEGFYENRRLGRIPLPRGTAFFEHIPGPFRYGYPRGASEPYEQVFISMGGPVAMRWWRRITRLFGPVLNLGVDTPIAARMIDIVRQQEGGTLPDRYVMSGQLYQLMMLILSALGRSRVETTPRVGQALSIIARRAHDSELTVVALANELKCSREYLARQFRAAIGVSPSDYLTQQRLRLAARRMRSSDEKLESVAKACGFGGANYLCRVFRQRVGVTPAQFRKNLWMAGP
jgi:AraC-like DNA-binding protein